MIYEWKNGSKFHPRRGSKVYDAITGEYIPLVYYIDTETEALRRFKPHPETGRPYFDKEANDVARIIEFRAVRIEWI